MRHFDQNWKRVLLSLALAVFAILPFWVNRSDYFLSDDWDFLTIVQDPPSISSAFTSNYLGTNEGGSYRPLVTLFWSATFPLFGSNPTGYHLLTIGFHAANTVLIFWLVLAVLRPKTERAFEIALVSSLLFATFPNHAEAVSWLAVNDPMMTLFYLSALACLLCATKIPGRARFIWYAGSLLLFACALFTKEMAMTFPFVAFVVFLATAKGNLRQNLLRAISWAAPFMLLLVGFFIIRFAAIGLFTGYYGPEIRLTLGLIYRSLSGFVLSHLVSDQLLTSLMSFTFVWKAPIVLVSSLALLGLLGLTYKRKWSWIPWVALAAFLVSTIPVLSFGINHTPIYFSSEGERYAYLPSIFFAIALASILVSGIVLLEKRLGKLGRGLGVSLLCVLLFFFASQLFLKTARWHEASVVGNETVDSAIEELTSTTFDGVVFIGVPDNFHGAMMFRNNFIEALQLNTDEELPVLLSIFARTAYAETAFEIEQINETTLLYRDESDHRLLARPEFRSADYDLILRDYIFEPNGINHRYFGSSLEVSLHDILLEGNRIGVFFFQPEGFEVLTFSQE